jgi:probable HAF family extracellular repeat protein
MLQKIVFFASIACTQLLAGPFNDVLLDAIYENNLPIVESYARNGAALNPMNAENTPLSVAATECRSEIVKVLIDGGADANFPTKYGIFPLNYCMRTLGNWYAEERHQELCETIQILVDAGADVNAKDPIGHSPLAQAMTYAYSTAFRNGKYDETFMLLLAQNGADVEEAKKQVSKPALEYFLENSKLNHRFDFGSSNYTIQDIGTLDNESSQSFCINNKGQIVGSHTLCKKTSYFIKELGAEKTIIDLPANATPITINDMGQIAGNYKDLSGQIRGFFWDKNSGWVDIGTLGGASTIVNSMNNHGHVVGVSETSVPSNLTRQHSLEKHAFVWKDRQIVDLGTLTGDSGVKGDLSVATGISDRGSIVGYSNKCLFHNNKYKRSSDHAFLIKSTDKANLLELCPQNPSSRAYGIDNWGNIILSKELSPAKWQYEILQEKTRNSEIFLTQSNGRDYQDQELIFILNNNHLFPFFSNLNNTLCYMDPKSNKIKSINIRQHMNSTPFWYKVKSISGINEQGIMVGTAQTIQGANHAIIIKNQE